MSFPATCSPIRLVPLAFFTEAAYTTTVMVTGMSSVWGVGLPWFFGRENVLFWTDLSAAGLIEGSFNDNSDELGGGLLQTLNSPPKCRVPRSAMAILYGLMGCITANYLSANCMAYSDNEWLSDNRASSHIGWNSRYQFGVNTIGGL